MDSFEGLIRETLDALDRLMRMFAMERLLYLACSVISFIVLMACLWIILRTGRVAVPELALAFGSTGLVAASAARVSFFLNKSFDLISHIIRELIALRTNSTNG